LTDAVLVGPALLAFVETLRRGGMRAETPRVEMLLEALRQLPARDLPALRACGHLTLCASAEEVWRFNACFDTFFHGSDLPPVEIAPDPEQPPMLPGSADAQQRQDSDDDRERELQVGATSDVEVLRHRRLNGLTRDELAQVFQLIVRLRGQLATRRSRRMEPWKAGALDIARTARDAYVRGGEPDRLRWRRRRSKPRKRVLLLDVSGSMAPFAGGLLRFGYAACRSAPACTEVFTFGTRLTRITPMLRSSDPELAIGAAGRAIPDWSGGTRIGDQLKGFLDGWGQRGMARGAIVLLASDGWERGEPDLLAAQMRRLASLAHRIIWANPHKSAEGFEPLTRGMQAALPFIDCFVPGSSAAEFAMLMQQMARP
jgi:hypothetical protein